MVVPHQSKQGTPMLFSFVSSGLGLEQRQQSRNNSKTLSCLPKITSLFQSPEIFVFLRMGPRTSRTEAKTQSLGSSIPEKKIRNLFQAEIRVQTLSTPGYLESPFQAQKGKHSLAPFLSSPPPRKRKEKKERSLYTVYWLE